MKIYIAGPYSAPTLEEREENVRRAIRAGVEVIRRGHVQFTPHLSHYIHELALSEKGWEIPYEEWMRQDMAFLADCDALLYLSPSSGADRELAMALNSGKQVFRAVAEVPFAHE